MPPDTDILGRAHDGPKIMEWVKLVLSLVVVPLVVTTLDLRESKALQAAELISVKAELLQIRADLRDHSSVDSRRIEQMDSTQRKSETILARMEETVTNTKGRLDEILTLVRRRL